MSYLPRLKGLHKKPVSQQLLDITPDYSDRRIAMLLADKCIALTDKPFRFSINHDIRPPKNLACPLYYDWSRKDRVGIETLMYEPLRKWLTKAFMLGYTVSLTNAERENISFPHSIEIVRRRAARRRHECAQELDDIPF